MLSKILGNSGGQPVAPTPTPARRQRGEQYASALAQFSELETALDDAVGRLDDALVHIKTLESKLAAIQHDNGQLLADRDWHRDRYVELRTQLNSMATQFYDCMRANTPEPIEGSKQQSQIASALTEVEKDLLKSMDTKDPNPS